MAIKHATVTVGVTATSLMAITDGAGYVQANSVDVSRTVVVQNNSVVVVYLGGTSVTTADYGYALAANGGEAAFDLTYGDVLYAVVASGTQSVRLLHLGV